MEVIPTAAKPPSSEAVLSIRLAPVDARAFSASDSKNDAESRTLQHLMVELDALIAPFPHLLAEAAKPSTLTALLA